MSGITPILDTLLHQVLGWQREAPTARALPDRLIPPPRPARPAAAMHSDSRLDPRALQTAVRGGATERAPGAEATGNYGAAAALAGGAGAVTRLSAAARVIGDILARYPEAAAVIRAQAPLLDTAGRADAAALAQALRTSIAMSGLFYEAHVRRWSNGTLPLAQLAREPQMAQRGRGGGANLPVPPGSASRDSGLYGLAGEWLSDPVATGAHQAARADGSVVRGGLEGVVRQQLELLAVPVLRWEGEAWPGLFVAMMLIPPWWRPDDPREGDENRQDQADGWRSTLVLHLRHLGEVAIDVRLWADRVAIGLHASPAGAGRLQAAGGELRHRIRSAGFRHVTVRVSERTRSGRARHG